MRFSTSPKIFLTHFGFEPQIILAIPKSEKSLDFHLPLSISLFPFFKKSKKPPNSFLVKKANYPVKTMSRRIVDFWFFRRLNPFLPKWQCQDDTVKMTLPGWQCRQFVTFPCSPLAYCSVDRAPCRSEEQEDATRGDREVNFGMAVATESTGAKSQLWHGSCKCVVWHSSCYGAPRSPSSREEQEPASVSFHRI